MFRNLKKKTKKNFNWKKKSKFNFFSCLSFAFGLYTLTSDNLQIVLKNNLHTQVDLK